MKKCCILCLTLFLCLFLTSALADAAPADPEQTVDLLTLQAMGIAPADMTAEGECTGGELYALLTGAARLKSGNEPTWSTLPDWVAYAGDDQPVSRLITARLLFEGYEQMGNAIDPSQEPVAYANGNKTMSCGEYGGPGDCPDFELFSPDVEGWHQTPTDWHNDPSEWFVNFIMRHKSLLDNGYVMDLAEDERFRPNDALTRGEAVTAVLRLYCSFGDWQDALAARTEAGQAYYASIGAQPVTFRSALLTDSVRAVLHKAEDAPIYEPELSRVYALHIVGSKLLDGRMESYQGEPAKYMDRGEDIAAAGVIFEDWSSSQGWDFYDLNDFALFTGLRELTLANQQITSIDGIAGLPLEYLDLRWNHFTDISALGSLSHLDSLFLQYTPVESLEALRGLRALRRINISQSNVRTLDGLDGVPNITWLNAQKMPLLTDISALAKCINPLYLFLDGMRDFSLLPLEGLAALRELTVACVTDEEAAMLGRLPSLETLGLSYVESDVLTALACPKLTSLYVGMSRVSSLGFIQDMPRLERMTVEFCAIDTLDGIQNAKSLKAFESSVCIIMDASALNGLTRLESVSLPTQAQGTASPACGVAWYQQDVVNIKYDKRMEMSANTNPYPGDEAVAAPEYVPFDSVGTFDEGIITPEILALEATSQLPEANLGGEVPVWHSLSDETLLCNMHNVYETHGYMSYVYEEYFAKTREYGLNGIGMFANIAKLTDGVNMDMVNIHALREIDQILAWAIQYDVHVKLNFMTAPLLQTQIGLYSVHDALQKDDIRALYAKFVSLYAKRYAGISNRYLSFELFPEADVGDPNSEWTVGTREVAKAIWEAEGSKPRDQKRLIFARVCQPLTQYAEAVAADGIGLTLEHSFPEGYYLYGGDADYGNPTFTVVNGSLQPTNLLSGLPDEPQDLSWPMLYFPNRLFGGTSRNTVSFSSEEGFPKGTVFTLYLDVEGVAPVSVTADGKKIFSDDGSGLLPYTTSAPAGNAITLKKAAKTVTFQNSSLHAPSVLKLIEITIEIPGREKLCLYPHMQGRYTNFSRVNQFDDVDIRIAADGSAESYVSGEVKRADAEEYYRMYLEQFIALAEAYGTFCQCPEFIAFTGGCRMSEENLYAFLNDMYAMYQRHNASMFNYLIAFGWEDLPIARSFVMPANFEGTPFTFDPRGAEIMSKYTAPMPNINTKQYTLQKMTLGELNVGNNGKVKVYAQPDAKSEVVYQPQKTEGFWITGTDGDWYEIMLPDCSYGWIRQKDCSWANLD